jgi:AcrR family transcriptional regulator
MAAAYQAVEKHGHPELSLRPLASKLGVTQPALYRHFTSKEALLAAVAVRAWTAFEAELGAAIQRHREPREALRASGRAYVRWAHAHPHLFRLLSSRVPAKQRSGVLPPFPREHYYHGLGRAVPIDEPRLADAFRAAWALSHGLATFVVEHTFQLVDTDAARLAAADGAIDVFVDMLLARWPNA